MRLSKHIKRKGLYLIPLLRNNLYFILYLIRIRGNDYHELERRSLNLPHSLSHSPHNNNLISHISDEIHYHSS